MSTADSQAPPGTSRPAASQQPGPPADPLSAVNTIEDLFRLLESNRADTAQKVKQSIMDLFSEVKDAWLVNGLYDSYCLRESPRILELLLSVGQEPHDRHLLDRICDGIKQGSKNRLMALSLLGYVVRKQPAWLYRVTQHATMKELIKALKTEEDLVVMMSGILDLLALMPILPAYIAPYLADLFEVFSRMASWRYQHIQSLPEIQQLHVQVGLYAFFHRLYGLFPCNFLSYLRTQYSENNKENRAVFTHTIRPMLSTVRMHPLLVTHSRDQERTSARFKRMELHDVVAESSRYSLMTQESTMEDREPPALDVGAYAGTLKSQVDLTPDIHSLYSAMSSHHDPMWTPSRKVELATPPPVAQQQQQLHPPHPTVTSSASGASLSKLAMVESPPEAAIEATPETTPFVTPVKDDAAAAFRFARPGAAKDGAAVRHLVLDHAPAGAAAASLSSSLKSPVAFLPPPAPASSAASSHAPSPRPPPAASRMPAANNPTSPVKEYSPFRFPPPAGEPVLGTSYQAAYHSSAGRRDSIFERPLTGSMEASHLASRLARLGTDRDNHSAAATPTSSCDTPGGGDGGAAAVGSVGARDDRRFLRDAAISSSSLLASAAAAEEADATGPKAPSATAAKSPSPVKFTSQRPEQFPIKPEPERPSRMLSLDNLREALAPGYAAGGGAKGGDDDEEAGGEDDEVTKITTIATGGHGPPASLDTRHITPQICASAGPDSSAATSRATSRLSVSSQPDQQHQFHPVRGGRPGVATPAECSSGGLHPPSQDSVDDFVRQVKGRIRFFSVCGPAADIAAEVSSILASAEGGENRGDDDAAAVARPSSCPDEHHLRDTATAPKPRTRKTEVDDSGTAEESGVDKSEAGDGGKGAPPPPATTGPRQSAAAGVQTDEFFVFPYEHLFPTVMPQWFSQPPGGVRGDERHPQKPDLEEANPYELLDQYIEATVAGKSSSVSDDVKALRNEVTMLHTLMLFERHRREVLGVRNRRLLGKTKSSRILEEQNTALRDQLLIVNSETQGLLSQLDSVRREKHQVEEARARGAKERDTRIEGLVRENRRLTEELEETRARLEKRVGEAAADRTEMGRLEGALFRAHSQIGRLEEKEAARQAAEEELVRLRREILLLGELEQRRKEEGAGRAASAAGRTEELFRRAWEEQVRELEARAVAAEQEAEAARGRAAEAEAAAARKDAGMAEQRRALARATDEAAERTAAVEEANEALKEVIAQQGAEIMNLQDKLSQASRPIRVARGVTTAQAAPPRHPPSAVAGVEISRGGAAGGAGRHPFQRPAGLALTTSQQSLLRGASDEKPFVVGSPPLSSGGGSFGSSGSNGVPGRPAAAAEALHLDTDDEYQPRPRMHARLDEEEEEPEVGRDAAAAGSSSTSSMNGRH